MGYVLLPQQVQQQYLFLYVDALPNGICAIFKLITCQLQFLDSCCDEVEVSSTNYVAYPPIYGTYIKQHGAIDGRSHYYKERRGQIQPYHLYWNREFKVWFVSIEGTYLFSSNSSSKNLKDCQFSSRIYL